METSTIGINGMSCGHCVAAVRKTLESVPGVKVEAVQIGSATVAFDPAVTSRALVEAAIDAAGFEVVSGRILNIAVADKSDGKSNA